MFSLPMLRFIPDTDERFRVLSFPCLLLLATEETHPGRFSLRTSVFLHRLHVSVDLYLVQSSVFIFAVQFLKTGFIAMLRTLNVAAEEPIEQRTVHFK